ncbi:uncharacterized protein LOC135697535 [Ochlerotatus camptorhynchus]|uniref:uncharacterized protein LOC135697535 n=1 Tax=Ochlerotatus camptorhynchus TaxID=644619 RepID=UPI0031CDB9B9
MDRKAKSAHSAGQKIISTNNNAVLANRNSENSLNPAATDSFKQLENQKPGTSNSKHAQKEGKAQLICSEGQTTVNSSTSLRFNNSGPANINTTNSSTVAKDSVIHDEPQIDIEVDTSPHQVGNVVMDILLDWTEFDAENNNDAVDDNASYEPPKKDGKTYSRSGCQSATKHRLYPIPQQIDLVNSNLCVCGHQEKIDELTKRNEEQAAQIEKWKLKSEETSRRCLRLTDALNAKILGNPHEDVFTVIEGFVTKDKLKKFSEVGQNSDYIFVKLLMHDLWPSGFGSRSVTGRSSNNPRGRNGTEGTGSTDQSVAATPKIPLEPNKVSYIEDRLEEHRLYQGDSAAVARMKAKECGRLMTRVIAYYGKKDGICAD